MMDDLFSEFSRLVDKEHGRLHLAMNLVRKREYREAFLQCSALLRSDPSYALAHMMQGAIYIMESKFSDAIDCCERVDTDDPKLNSEANIFIAYCKRAQGEDDSALFYLGKSLASRPGNFLAAYYSGEILLSRQRWREAIDFFHITARTNPFNSVAYYRIAYAWSRLDNERAAIDAAASGLRCNETYSGHMSLGNLLYAQGDLESAMFEFHNAMAFSPGMPDAPHMLGECSLQLGDIESAALYFRTALMIHPGMFDALAGLGDVELANRDPEQAVVLFLKALKLQRYLPRAYHGLYEAYSQLRQPARAAVVLLDVCSHAGLACGEASTLVEQGSYEEALEHLRTAMNLPGGSKAPKSKITHSSGRAELPVGPRSATRAKLSIDLQCRDDAGNVFGVSVVDISPSGLLLECRRQLSTGDRLTMGLRFDRYQEYEHLCATVVREESVHGEQWRDEHGVTDEGMALRRFAVAYADDLVHADNAWSRWLIGRRLSATGLRDVN